MLDPLGAQLSWCRTEPALAALAYFAPGQCAVPALGHGHACASFGEIVQGRRGDGEDFLITLPVALWSRCRIRLEPIAGPSRVEAPLPKSRCVAEKLLQMLGAERGIRLRIALERDMPIGKGLSSSTADMLAVVRACQELFGAVLSEDAVSRLFASIEPHDPLHYPMSVAYNHRRGRLLAWLGYVPDFHIVGVDAGGMVCTERYNQGLDFSPTCINRYQRLYERALAAFARRDDAAIARCAWHAAELHVARTGNRFLRRLLAQVDSMDVLGLLPTHSGTCGGILLPGNVDAAQLEAVQAQVEHLGHVFRTRTLRPSPLAPPAQPNGPRMAWKPGPGAPSLQHSG